MPEDTVTNSSKATPSKANCRGKDAYGGQTEDASPNSTTANPATPHTAFCLSESIAQFQHRIVSDLNPLKRGLQKRRVSCRPTKGRKLCPSLKSKFK